LKSKTGQDFRQLRARLLLRTAAMLAAAVFIVYAVYTLLLRGRFASWVIGCLQSLFRMDYAGAFALYERTFRSRMDLILLLSMLLVFAVLFCVYLRWFTGYFEKINAGLDALLQDVPGEISLPSELLSIERKLNAAKLRIDRQKSDMLASEQRKNDLIMYLAHDLKTPLASSVSYLHLLRDERQLSEELREKYLSISLSKAERLEELVDEFLEIAKYSLSGMTLEYSRINLTRLLEQLAYEFQPILAQKRLTCRLTAADDIPLACDANKLQRVFDNLLRNAVIYSYEGTEITIEAAEREDCLTLKFSNHGDTIPKEKLERIFEQFYRLDTGRGTGGTGLGLAIAKQITALHKGTLTAESENNLTVFVVTLPVL
jgi:two-component system sensor histidine kinase VanS